jgi:hypothetical protein
MSASGMRDQRAARSQSAVRRTALGVRDRAAVKAGPARELALVQAGLEPPCGYLPAQAAPGGTDRVLLAHLSLARCGPRRVWDRVGHGR